MKKGANQIEETGRTLSHTHIGADGGGDQRVCERPSFRPNKKNSGLPLVDLDDQGGLFRLSGCQGMSIRGAQELGASPKR